MTLTTKEIKARYLELQRQSQEAYKAAEPERKALEEAERPHRELEEQIDAFLDEHDKEVIDNCETCCEPIFEGDRCTGGEFNLCEECAPSWKDMLDSPENFQDVNEERLTFDRAREMCDYHIACGGTLEDKMVS